MVPVFAAVVQNISEQEQLLEILRDSRKMELLRQLAGGIAHDFNNVLNILVCNLEVLKRSSDEPDTKERRQLFSDAHHAIHLGMRLTEKLLSLAGKGTGLGLAMVESFARKSGGHVTSHSEPGNGTEICIILPRYLEESSRISSLQTT
jgi:signal transduction histidine kinase